MRGFMLPVTGQLRADVSGADSLTALMSNVNNYLVQVEDITLSGTLLTLTANQVFTGVIKLASGASGNFVIQLPPTDRMIDALGPTVRYDGTYSVPISILNKDSTYTGTLTAPADGQTTIVGTATVAPGERRVWVCHVKQRVAASGPVQLEFIDIGATGASGGTSSSCCIDPTMPPYNAVADGVTDCTAAFNAAIAAAAALGGGIVCVPCANNYYKVAGQITLLSNVVFAGETQGSTGRWGTGVTTPAKSVTLGITNIATTAFSVTGSGAAIQNVIFYWPNQVNPDQPTPTPYPYAITATGSDFLCTRVTTVNATHAIDIEQGPAYLSYLRLGATNVGIHIDKCGATVDLFEIQIGAALWDQFLNFFPFPQLLDVYTFNNLVCIDVGRADAFQWANITTFVSQIGVRFDDGVVTGVERSGYGHISNIDIEASKFGIICKSTNSGIGAGGVKITNLNMLASPGGGLPASGYGIWMQAAGVRNPFMQVSCGFIGGTWANLVQYDAGVLEMKMVENVDYPGGVPLVVAVVPATGVPYQSPFPYSTMAYIADTGSTVTDVAINGSSLGGGAPIAWKSVMVPPNATIAVSYTGALPTWVWMSGL